MEVVVPNELGEAVSKALGAAGILAGIVQSSNTTTFAIDGTRYSSDAVLEALGVDCEGSMDEIRKILRQMQDSRSFRDNLNRA